MKVGEEGDYIPVATLTFRELMKLLSEIVIFREYTGTVSDYVNFLSL